MTSTHLFIYSMGQNPLSLIRIIFTTLNTYHYCNWIIYNSYLKRISSLLLVCTVKKTLNIYMKASNLNNYIIYNTLLLCTATRKSQLLMLSWTWLQIFNTNSSSLPLWFGKTLFSCLSVFVWWKGFCCRCLGSLHWSIRSPGSRDVCRRKVEVHRRRCALCFSFGRRLGRRRRPRRVACAASGVLYIKSSVRAARVKCPRGPDVTNDTSRAATRMNTSS